VKSIICGVLNIFTSICAILCVMWVGYVISVRWFNGDKEKFYKYSVVWNKWYWRITPFFIVAMIAEIWLR